LCGAGAGARVGVSQTIKKVKFKMLKIEKKKLKGHHGKCCSSFNFYCTNLYNTFLESFVKGKNV